MCCKQIVEENGGRGETGYLLAKYLPSASCVSWTSVETQAMVVSKEASSLQGFIRGGRSQRSKQSVVDGSKNRKQDAAF